MKVRAVGSAGRLFVYENFENWQAKPVAMVTGLLGLGRDVRSVAPSLFLITDTNINEGTGHSLSIARRWPSATGERRKVNPVVSVIADVTTAPKKKLVRW